MEVSQLSCRQNVDFRIEYKIIHIDIYKKFHIEQCANNSNVTIYQLFYYFEIPKYQFQGLVDPFMYEDLLFNFFVIKCCARPFCFVSVIHNLLNWDSTCSGLQLCR